MRKLWFIFLLLDISSFLGIKFLLISYKIVFKLAKDGLEPSVFKNFEIILDHLLDYWTFIHLLDLLNIYWIFYSFTGSFIHSLDLLFINWILRNKIEFSTWLPKKILQLTTKIICIIPSDPQEELHKLPKRVIQP